MQKILALGIAEDIGNGDITTLAVTTNINAKKFKKKAVIISKSKGIVAGLSLVKTIFTSKKIKVQLNRKDGDKIEKGDTLATLQGDYPGIVSYERIALNFLQRLSGIASLTHEFQEKLKGSTIKILDTRKTIPGYRLLEKYAVYLGGGQNHRFSLNDEYLLKDNHVDFVGGITPAINKIKEHQGKKKKRKLTVECRSLKEVEEASQHPLVDQILLDNFSLFSLNSLKKAINTIKKNNQKMQIEVSGNVNLKNLTLYKKLPIDYLSSGAITHSAPALDISLKLLD